MQGLSCVYKANCDLRTHTIPSVFLVAFHVKLRQALPTSAPWSMAAILCTVWSLLHEFPQPAEQAPHSLFHLSDNVQLLSLPCPLSQKICGKDCPLYPRSKKFLSPLLLKDNSCRLAPYLNSSRLYSGWISGHPDSW